MKLQDFFKNDWLCSLEILEILEQENIYPSIKNEIKEYLEQKASADPSLNKLINDGFYLIKHPVAYLDTADKIS